MRVTILFHTVIILLLTGCKPYSYFKTPNDLLNKNCIVHLTDGTIKQGKLTIQFETGLKGEKPIYLKSEKDGEEKIPIEKLLYYKSGEEYYYPKIIDLNLYEIPIFTPVYLNNVRNIVFVKRLTAENAKIMFYELYKSRIGSLDGAEQHDYFISFRTDHRLIAWDIRSIKFFPNFAEKMSQLVSDCPLLADKIRQQAKGYYAGQIFLDVKRYEIFKRIVDEYNACN
jgi:hypothetical protein